MAHIRRILVPCDGSPPSLAALHEATLIAEELGASVDVLHVAPEESALVATAPSAEELAELDHALEEARRALGERVRRRTERGEPVEAILAAARDGYDLVVMGTHGRIGRLHALMGSVTAGVVRNAPVPVLTVRERRGEESFAERRHRRPSVAEAPR